MSCIAVLLTISWRMHAHIPDFSVAEAATQGTATLQLGRTGQSPHSSAKERDMVFRGFGKHRHIPEIETRIPTRPDPD